MGQLLCLYSLLWLYDFLLLFFFFWYWSLNSGPTPWVTPSALFSDGFFRDRVSQAIYLGWLWTIILLISASWVAGITCVSHQRPVDFLLFFFCLGTAGNHTPFWIGWELSPSTSWSAYLCLSLGFPLPWARCSVVYITSPRHGTHVPRDKILSLVLAHGTVNKEFGVGQEMGPKLKLRLGLAESIPRCSAFGWEPLCEQSCLFLGKSVISLPLLWAPCCDAVSVYSIQRHLSFPF
jgi:hypothetical protein